MQYINLNKNINLEKNIVDLILISIDDQINIADDKEGIKISGNILVSGKVKTIEGEEEINDSISLDLFLMYEEVLERNLLNISVNDFNYEIKEENLLLSICLKIEGLKEIDTTFLAQEGTEYFNQQVEQKNEKIETDEEQIEDNENFENKDESCKEVHIEVDIDKNDRNEGEKIIDQTQCIEQINYNNQIHIQEDNYIKSEKKSLLKSVFSNRRINEDVSWKLHCVKNGDSYETIAKKYNLNLNKLISLNNNEKLEEGKLIFLPLD